MNRPEINVTPLIDVLLVLLIIFMIVTPTKLSSFKAKVPQEPSAERHELPHPDTLIVSVEGDSALRLNKEAALGSIGDPQPMIERLRAIFDKRHETYGDSVKRGGSVPRGVFIKAPPQLDYGSVAKLVDAVKTAGADPIALQIDELN